MSLVRKDAAWLALLTGVLAIAAVVTRRRFRAGIDGLERTLIDTQGRREPRIDLPLEVAALAARLGAKADKPSSHVRFCQSGAMWMKPGGSPRRFTARQCIGTSGSGFVWRADVAAMGGIWVVDSFVRGRGLLEARLFGALRVARSDSNAMIDQGEMLRYLAELPLNPDAILFDHALEWSVAGSRTIGVAAGSGDARAEIEFGLDDGGIIVTGSAASRAYGTGGKRHPWRGRFWDYRTVHGRRLPMRAEVAWVIDGADFTYWRATMTDWRPFDGIGPDE